LLGAAVFLAPPEAGAATDRILLVGDSWTQYMWKDRIWQTVLGSYGLSQWEEEGTTTAVSGSTAEAWADNWPNPLDGNRPVRTGSLHDAIVNNPTIDIVHLSLSGNDLLGKWKADMTPAQMSAVYDEVQADLETVVDYVLGLRPDLKVALVDYDFVNIYEPALAGLQGAMLQQAYLNNPSPGQLNQAFVNMGLRKRTVAGARNRVLYIQNFGLEHFRYGHAGFWDIGLIYRPPFAAQTSPLPGAPLGYSPYPGGVLAYPSSRQALADGGDDTIHLNQTGYKDVAGNCLYQGYALWLQDYTGPTVVSIARTGGQYTAAASVQFVVTFSESIRSLVLADFALDTTIPDAVLQGISGSGSSWTVTVGTGTQDGSLSIDFIDRDTVYDTAWRPAGSVLGNNANASFTAGQTYMVSRSPATAAMSSGTPSPSAEVVVPVNVTWIKPVTGFTVGDITCVNGSAANLVTTSGTGADYRFDLIVQTGLGATTVTAEIPAGVVTDLAGTANAASPVFSHAYQPAGAVGDIYLSDGHLGDLIVASGNIAVNTGANPPTLSVNGGPLKSGRIVLYGGGGGVAMFDFADMDVAPGVTVQVTGSRPLSLAASGDAVFGGTVDVSGTEDGRAGGGVGSTGGTGGGGGGGGPAGGGGSGGLGGAGGDGGYFTYTGAWWIQFNGTAGADGVSGGSTGSLSSNATGGIGQSGNAATAFGGHGFNNATGGGSPGSGNTSPGTGGARASSGGGGGGRAIQAGLGWGGASCSGSMGCVAGWGAEGRGGTGGNNAPSAGSAGNTGNGGGLGGSGTFSAAPDALDLHAGPAGGGAGGGSGGGGGGGGAGGGGGGGGAGGGGGGAVKNGDTAGATWVGGGGGGGGSGSAGGNASGASSRNYGGSGGNGATGGAGGAGATGGPGGNGGKGGNGGGAVVLAARGLLELKGIVDLSAGAAGSAGTGSNGGSAGTGQTTPAVPGGAGGVMPVILGLWYPGNGGNGGAGGAGGRGSDGGGAGRGGDGGAAGKGTPGMLKLHGSVVLAGTGSVSANNGPGTAPDQSGKYTVISNMSATAEQNNRSAFTGSVYPGRTTHDAALRSVSVYSPSVTSPLLPQLQGGPAVSGFTKTSYWNKAGVDAALPAPAARKLIEMIVLDSGSYAVFEGFKQVFLVNTSATQDASGVTLQVQDYGTVNVGTIPAGQTWTTCAPIAKSVTFSVEMLVDITPLAVDYYTGGTLTLTANVSGGLGTKTFVWRRDGVEVQNGASALYTRAEVYTGDTGVYTVSVTDQLPQTIPGSNSVTVLIDDPVQIVQPPVGVMVMTGDNLMLAVAVSGGKRGLTYDWRKDGVSLGLASQPYLYLSPVQATASGAYSVTVRDALGVAPQGSVTSADAVVMVIDPLTVVGPSDVAVYEGTASVQFQVAASGGLPTYTYLWFKDANRNGAFDSGEDLAEGGHFSGTTTAILVIAGPVATDQGDYQCVVRDNGGAGAPVLSVQGTLTLVPHLSIVTHPLDAVRNPGQSVTFAVEARGGVPPLQYTWRKAGVALPPENQPGGPILNILSAAETDEGSYDVVVRDSGTDSVTSNAALLTVVNTPLQITQHPANRQMYVGSVGSYTLTVSTSGGYGSVTQLWKKDGAPAPGVNNQASYVISNPQPGDSGVYTCEVSDSVPGNTLVSNPATVLIANHMAFTQVPTDLVRPPGGQAIFSVTVTGGLGALHYQWKFDDGSGAPQNRGTDAAALTLDPVAAGDAGQYWVEVSDLMETLASARVRLYVGETLQITQQPVGLRAYTGESSSHTLTATVAGGYGPVGYLWLKNSAPAPGVNNQASYTLASLSPAESGAYALVATDDVGSVTSDPAIIEIADRMQFEAQPSGRSIDVGGSCTFTVTVTGGLGPLNYQWMFDDGTKTVYNVGGNSPSLGITDAAPENAGLYWVEVSDDRELKVSGAAALTVGDTGLPLAAPLSLTLIAAALALLGGTACQRRTGRQ
jgi:hypothetical protein